MALEQRLKRIELRLNPQPKQVNDPGYLDLMDLPRETVVEAFAIVKEATGGYHHMFAPDLLERAGAEQCAALNRITPEQLYDLAVRHESMIQEAKP